MRKMRHKIPNEVYYLLIAACLLLVGWYMGLITAQYFQH